MYIYVNTSIINPYNEDLSYINIQKFLILIMYIYVNASIINPYNISKDSCIHRERKGEKGWERKRK